ncbi:hypothetical protein K461DRAFT_278091 [Myriangium duriaei CBS 260.36]|uniref:BTB domain-containing protein n=1 Tax=Myriangium duriaei CBS 260.36 TaxID=1168546 RepID=A0A9P4J0J7_9PEZI|nr:hypothetical protein K461DRAFT_278091 [Myriangium duriaei CBS 260.36]
MEEGNRTFYSGPGESLFLDGASESSQSTAAIDPSATTPRPSLFSNGAPSSRNSIATLSPPMAGHNRPPVLSEDPRELDRSSPLSMLATMPSPPQYPPSAEASDSHRPTPHRPRIPRVEKESDDPSTPVQSRGSLARQQTSTPTTLTRLFAANAPVQDSRSPSFSAAVEFQPRALIKEPTSMTGHLHTEGLLAGKFSDITVNAFSTGYRLHRLLLARAPFFDKAFSGGWLESSSKEISLHPADVDSNINRYCFELALKRLYGVPDERAEAANAAGLFATGCWLEMSDLIDSSIENMLRQMAPENLTPLIKLVTKNYYGRAGDKILASSKAMLCRHGWKMPISNWDRVPADIIREIVGGDGFYVSGEWERWVLATRILNRRLKKMAVETGLVQPGTRKAFEAPDVVKLMAVRFDNVYRRNYIRTATGLPENVHRWISVYTHHDVEPLLVLLDEGIYYMHLDYEHLQYIRKATDIFGLPVMPDKVVSDALWMQLELRQKVINASEDSLELGLSQETEDPEPQSSAVHGSPVSTHESSWKGKQRDMAISTLDEGEEMVSDSWDGNGKPRKFWIPSADCNIVMGGSSDPVITSSPTPSAARHAARLSGTLQPEDVQWAADFGAAAADTRPVPGMRPSSAGGAAPSNPIGPVAFTHFPPFRFAVEFQNPRLLKGKKRFYSRTIFYAGSLWNIYIQKLRQGSKAPQLGVYLHRAKEQETEEALVNTAGLGQGSVDERIGLLEREMLLRHSRITTQSRRRIPRVRDGETVLDDDSSGSADADASLLRSDGRHANARSNPLSRFTEPTYRKSLSASDSPLMVMHKQRSSSSPTRFEYDENETSDEDEMTTDPELARLSAAPHVHTLPAYVDVRPKIKTYFKIYSPSKGGRMLSVYESVPSDFNFSQSWGWKSSTLMVDEGLAGDVFLGTLQDDAGNESAVVDREGDDVPKRTLSDGKLRFMVVIGNV